MNFLSHYYFDKNIVDSYKVLGALLPDLTKNANKDWKLFPEKKQDDLYSSVELKSLTRGWKKHLAIDRIFHNMSSFFYHQHELKEHIAPLITGSPIKPFFIGHIGFELCLDHLLLKHNKIDLQQLYAHLKTIDYPILDEFLKINGITNTISFFNYYTNFVKEEYLKTYIKPESISYAIKRICLRIWETPLSSQQKENITQIIGEYISLLEEDFMVIFDEIEAQLINE